MPAPSSPTSLTPPEKIVVSIRCGISYLGDIDVIRQQFTCELWMTATWREPRLVGKKHEDINWENEWSPKISFSNSLFLDRVYKGRRLYYEENNKVPLAQEVYKVRGTFKEHFDLTDFPLDYQELSIILSSDWSDKKVTFQKDMMKPDCLRHESFSAPREWVLCPHVHTDSTNLEGEGLGSSDRSYPMYIITTHVRRRTSPYFWNTALLMFVLAALSLASFAVPPQLIADRLSVTLTILLISVAYKFVTSQNLPKIPYLTLLDKYVLILLLFIAFVAILNAVAIAVPVTSQEMYDRVCLYAGIVLFVIIDIVAGVVVFYKYYMANKELHKFERGFQNRNDEIERQRRERDWYAERSKQPKAAPVSPSIVLTPISKIQKSPGNGYYTGRNEAGAPLASPDKSIGLTNKSYV